MIAINSQFTIESITFSHNFTAKITFLQDFKNSA
jgi:hypothetical protein